MILVAFFLLFFVFPGYSAAVTRDTVTAGEKGNSGTTLTISHTVTALGGNRSIYVLCGLRSRTVTATATYAGQAMTEIAGVAHGATNLRVYIFRKTGPATGANDWVVTQSSATAMACWAFSATNVDQITPETDTDNSCAGGNSPSLTLTTATNEILLDVMGLSVTSAGTPGANQTEESDQVTSENTLTVAGSRQDGADGGAMTYTGTGGTSCYSAVAIKHAAFTPSSFGVLRRR